jgi:hypothetical protein
MAAVPDENILDINGMSFDPDTAVENQSAVQCNCIGQSSKCAFFY